MSMYMLATGTLVSDPVRRTGQSGADYATATIRCGSGDDATWISIVAFNDSGERLLELIKADAVSPAGRAELSAWTGRDGAERRGLRIVASEIAAARPRRRSNSESRSDGAANRRPTRSKNVYRGNRFPGTPPARPAAAAMADDRLDDLWTGAAP
jgi:single-stranded DNA-binding protein